LAGEKVLVVEDKPEMIQILTDYVLGPQGYVTLTALNGEEGLRMALSGEPDLVLLDLRLPKMSGLQVLQTLREQQCSVPVIVITAYGSEEVVVRALRLGANDYIAKPFELDEMIHIIEKVLSQSGRGKVRLSQELEISVKELTKKLELILHSVDEGVFTVNREMRILTFNPAAERILGWREEEVIGRPYAEIFREEEGTLSYQEELLSEAMSKAQLVTSMKEGYPVTSKDGQRISIASSVVPLLNLDGQVVGAMAAFHDVSAEKAQRDRRAARTRQAIERKFNPYISGGPVREPDMFFGRDEALAEVLNTIHNNHVAIYGERRIGKTSLLYQLDNRLREVEDPQYLFIPAFVSLQGVPAERLFYTLMGAIARNCQPRIGSLNLICVTKKKGYDVYDLVDDLKTVLEALEATTDKQIRLVLLLDEGDELNKYDPRVQARLRGVFMTKAGRYLRIVWSGLSIDKEWKLDTSPWYNLFAISIRLAPFTREEAVRLIEEPVKGIYRYDEDAIELILQYSEYKPFHIQQICLATINCVLAQKRRRGTGLIQVTKEDVERAYLDLAAAEAISREVEERGKVGLLEKGVRVDVDAGEVWVDGQAVPTLTNLEYRLLLLLYSNIEKICDKDQVVEAVWEGKYFEELDDARIMKLVSRLRQKIEPEPFNPRYLVTVRGRGYKLVSS
jgi:PAS domain S-box-containing protein